MKSHTVTEPENALQVSFSPSVDDQYRAHRAVQRARPWVRAFEIGFPLLIGANIVMAILSNGWRPLFSGLGMIFPLALVLSLLKPHLARWTFARHRRRNPHLYGVQSWAVSAAGVHVAAPNGDVHLQWNGIVRARETEMHFLLYVTHDWAYFIPKRVLRERDEARLRVLLTERLGKKAELRNG